jgi:hypothetical protein
VLIIRRINCINTTSGMCHSDRLVYRSGRNFLTCILDGHLHSVTHIRCCIDTIDSPDDEHEFARNMQGIEINIQKKKELCVKLVIYKNLILLSLIDNFYQLRLTIIKGSPGKNIVLFICQRNYRYALFSQPTLCRIVKANDCFT